MRWARVRRLREGIKGRPDFGAYQIKFGGKSMGEEKETRSGQDFSLPDQYMEGTNDSHL